MHNWDALHHTHTHTHTHRHRYVYLLYTQEFCVPTDLYIMLGNDIIDKSFNQPGDIFDVLRKIIKLQINEKKRTTLNGLKNDQKYDFESEKCL